MNLPVVQPHRVASPPIFAKVGIVGLGLIGGSIAMRARELWPSSLVIAVDNKDVLETAMRLHAIDVAADDLIVLAGAAQANGKGTVQATGDRAPEANDPLERLPAFVRPLGSEPRTLTADAHD